MRKRIDFTILMVLFGLSSLYAGKIPVIYITTADSSAITSREYWKENTRLRIVMPDGSVSYQSKSASVRARGNSTYNKPKKSYALKLGKDTPLLGMTANKRWVLLANFMDHSLLRNSLALAIAKQTSLEWTADSRLVDVVVNGKLQGCYLFCETIRIDKHRVNIDKEEGFLIEIDNYPNEEYRFETKYRHLPVNVTYPKSPTNKQMKNIESFLNRIERILYDNGTDLGELYRNYIDLDSFVDWWLVHELIQRLNIKNKRQ